MAGVYKSERDSLERSLLLSHERLQVAEGNLWATEVESEVVEKTANAEVRAALARAETEIAELKARDNSEALATLEAQVEDLKKQNSEALATLQAQVEDLKKQNRELKSENTDLKNAQARDSMTLACDQLEDLKKQNRELKNENTDLKNAQARDSMLLASQKLNIEKGDRSFAAVRHELALKTEHIKDQSLEITWLKQRLSKLGTEASLEKTALVHENNRLVAENVASKGRPLHWRLLEF